MLVQDCSPGLLRVIQGFRLNEPEHMFGILIVLGKPEHIRVCPGHAKGCPSVYVILSEVCLYFHLLLLSFQILITNQVGFPPLQT